MIWIVRTLVSIFMALVMALVATGIPQAAHERQHEQEDAREALAAQALAASQGKKLPPVPANHSHDDCPICQQFHSPVVAWNRTVWLIDTGKWVEFVSMLAVSQHSQTVPSRISCRGPPGISC
jgi:hypothetical protein